MGESLVFSFISFPQAKHRKALPEINDIEFHLLVRGSCLGKSAFRSRRRKSMKKKNTALAGALLLVLAGWSAADAAEIYTLDPVIVTAERTDTKELKTPAAVEIITAKQISETGAANMQEALKFSTGIITSSRGLAVSPRGQ